MREDDAVDPPLFAVASQRVTAREGRHEAAARALLAHPTRQLPDDAARTMLDSTILGAARAVDVAETAAALAPTVAAARAIATTTRTLVDTLQAAGILTPPAAPAAGPAPDPFLELVRGLSGDDDDQDG